MASNEYDIVDEWTGLNKHGALLSEHDPMLAQWWPGYDDELLKNVSRDFDHSNHLNYYAGENFFHPKSSAAEKAKSLKGTVGCVASQLSNVQGTSTTESVMTLVPTTTSCQQPSSPYPPFKPYSCAEAPPPNPPLKQRGRPVKISSHTKQAMYARAYRDKHKKQVLAYEQRIAEQDKQIKALIAERNALQERLLILDQKFNNLKSFVSNDALVQSSAVIINHLVGGH